jgi:inosine-uridine nucleoside N-ribohydrolase
MAPRKIIIDTDPGQDDAAAIMLALGSPEDVDILGITTVSGNVSNGQPRTPGSSASSPAGPTSRSTRVRRDR